MLRSASALEAFRRRHRQAVSGPVVADLLIFDRDFPRSLAFCIDELRANFQSAIGGLAFPQAVPAAREILLLQLDLQASSIARVIATGLHEFIDWFQVRLIDIDQELGDHLLHALPEPVPDAAAPAATAATAAPVAPAPADLDADAEPATSASRSAPARTRADQQ